MWHTLNDDEVGPHAELYLSFLSIAVIKIITGSNLRRRGFIWHVCPNRSLSWGEANQEFQSGTEARTAEECFLLACSHGLFSLLSRTIQDLLPRGSPNHNEPSLPASMAKKEDAPVDLSICQSDRGLFSTESLSSQMTLACLKLAKLPSLVFEYFSWHSEKSLGSFCIFSSAFQAKVILVWCLPRVGSKEMLRRATPAQFSHRKWRDV